MKNCLISRLGALLALLFTGICLCLPGLTFAADTVETWDAGATDVDFYLGFDGLDPKRGGHAVYGDIMPGYGIVEHFSVYLDIPQNDEVVVVGLTVGFIATLPSSRRGA